MRSTVALLLALFTFSNGKPLKAPQVKSNGDALKFFDKFGYNKCGVQTGGKPSKGEPLCQASFKSMLEHFQTVFHLPVTGKLDKATTNLMNRPRCSLGDYPLAYSAFRPW